MMLVFSDFDSCEVVRRRNRYSDPSLRKAKKDTFAGFWPPQAQAK